MELISTISSFILYFSIALIAVVITSYIFFKLVKVEEETTTKKVSKDREVIRQYINHHRKYVATSTASHSQRLSQRIYSAPTYSDMKLRSSSSGRFTATSVSNSRNMSFQQRYTVINKVQNVEDREMEANEYQGFYSRLKESGHHKY